MSSSKVSEKMTWDLEAHYMLLLTILETHCTKMDYQSIADAWPQGGTRPTARAIKERISKIKKGEASTGISSSGAGAAKSSNSPATPKPPRRAPGKTKATPSTPKNKRSDEETDGEEPVSKKPKGKGKGNDKEIAQNSFQDDAASEENEYDSV
ncbi:hypothetical protein N7490_004898 [Penicillium lividum]|nr:hypothetical protein N7490_004898 [Penicillium lividum]